MTAAVEPVEVRVAVMGSILPPGWGTSAETLRIGGAKSGYRRSFADTVKPMENFWPPFAVTIRACDDTGRGVDLRVMRDEDIAQVAQVCAVDIYGATIPEHAFPWLFDEKTNTTAAMAQHRWEHRAQLRVDNWTLDFIVLDVETQELVGVVDLSAENFAAAREVQTASWVLHRFQGQGYGTLIRQAAVSYTHLTLPTNREV